VTLGVIEYIELKKNIKCVIVELSRLG
jgi:hypothetical protein